MSFKTIVVPFDFSPSSELALEKACELAQQVKAEIHLIHVRSHGTDDQIASLERLLTVGSPSYEIQNKVHREVLVGNVPDELIRYADRLRADLIVMGSRGRSGLVAMALGSVAQRVVRSAHCPVMLQTFLQTSADKKQDSDTNSGSVASYESLKASDSPALDLLARAISLRATDIHIDPLDDKVYSIRFRIDGLIVPYCNVDSGIAERLIHQYLVLARLDQIEPFRPREGRLLLPSHLNEVETRLTTTPVTGGSALALRIFEKAQASFALDDLGFGEKALETVQQILRGNEGLFLITGPTGSGKTTTVYSMLKTFAETNKNIVSIEDPVEFDVPYVRQMNVDDKHGVTMTTGLRTLLRMDPDVLFLGEIRDPESSDIAMRAANAGRFVFSTMHTRDVASTITGLRNMKVSNQSISTSLVGVINQRLIRRLCTHCRLSVDVGEECRQAFEDYRIALPEQIYESQGCDHCRGTGYSGRNGLFECVAMNQELLDAVTRNASESELRTIIREQGISNLISDALFKVANGTTSYKEANTARWV